MKNIFSKEKIFSYQWNPLGLTPPPLQNPIPLNFFFSNPSLSDVYLNACPRVWEYNFLTHPLTQVSSFHHLSNSLLWIQIPPFGQTNNTVIVCVGCSVVSQETDSETQGWNGQQTPTYIRLVQYISIHTGSDNYWFSAIFIRPGSFHQLTRTVSTTTRSTSILGLKIKLGVRKVK